MDIKSNDPDDTSISEVDPLDDDDGAWMSVVLAEGGEERNK